MTDYILKRKLESLEKIKLIMTLSQEGKTTDEITAVTGQKEQALRNMFWRWQGKYTQFQAYCNVDERLSEVWDEYHNEKKKQEKSINSRLENLYFKIKALAGKKKKIYIKPDDPDGYNNLIELQYEKKIKINHIMPFGGKSKLLIEILI